MKGTRPPETSTSLGQDHVPPRDSWTFWLVLVTELAGGVSIQTRRPPSQVSDAGTGPRIGLVDSRRTAHRHAGKYRVQDQFAWAGVVGDHHLTGALDE